MHTPAKNASRALAMAHKHLSEGERNYCEARLAGAVPVQAARMAGVDSDEAMSLEAKSAVQQYIRNALKVREYERDLTRQDVLNGLMDATHMASTATEMVAAWREIGKVIGAYEPEKKEVTITDKRQIQEMSDDDLARLAIDGEYEIVDLENTPQIGNEEQGSG